MGGDGFFRRGTNRSSLANGLSISSRPYEFQLPGDRFSMEEAVQVIDQWLQLPQVQLLVTGERHWNLFRRMLLEGQVRGPLTTDANSPL